MTKLLLLILTRTVRALTKRPLPAKAILLELNTNRARMFAYLAVVDDVASSNDGFGVRATILRILFVGLDGFHARVVDLLHALHGGYFVFLWGWIGESMLLKVSCVCVCVLWRQEEWRTSVWRETWERMHGTF